MQDRPYRDAAKKVCVPKIGFPGPDVPTYTIFMQDAPNRDAAGRDAAKEVSVSQIGSPWQDVPTYNIFMQDQPDPDTAGRDAAKKKLALTPYRSFDPDQTGGSQERLSATRRRQKERGGSN